jgi:acyl-CoA synthetase (AMP-forming)/AMP-acid ligase II
MRAALHWQLASNAERAPGADVKVDAADRPGERAGTNVAAEFVRAAAAQPARTALVVTGSLGTMREITFTELDRWSNGYAHGFRRAGLEPGDRVLVLMRPGAEFIALVLGLVKSGIVLVLIDPGMDRASFLGCVESASPRALVGALPVRLLATLRPGAFASVRTRWLAGHPWAPGAVERLRQGPPAPFECNPVADGAAAAIVFTTGSTGAPKGVVYTHGNYLAQLGLLRHHFTIVPGEVAVPGYLPFAVLCLCLGSTTVIPRFDPSRPASVDPRAVMELVKRYRPTYGLGSPAFWGRIGEHCARTGDRMEGMRLLLLFGAEVHESILRGLRAALPGGAEIHTPYGSTEAQPITSASDRELLDPRLLARRSDLGVCAGRPLEGVEVELVRITDESLELGDRGTCSVGAIGEVAVRGPMVTRAYFRQPEQDRLHKIGGTAPGAWHRMGDCGSFDEAGRLWLAGRKTQRVETAEGTLFPLIIEARATRHAAVRRSALVGVGVRGAQRPVLVVELIDSATPLPARAAIVSELLELVANESVTRPIRDVLIHPRLPMDYRHNAKIQREELARWAARELG